MTVMMMMMMNNNNNTINDNNNNINIKITDNEYDGSDDDEIIDDGHEKHTDGRW